MRLCHLVTDACWWTSVWPPASNHSSRLLSYDFLTSLARNSNRKTRSRHLCASAMDFDVTTTSLNLALSDDDSDDMGSISGSRSGVFTQLVKEESGHERHTPVPRRFGCVCAHFTPLIKVTLVLICMNGSQRSQVWRVCSQVSVLVHACQYPPSRCFVLPFFTHQCIFPAELRYPRSSRTLRRR